MLVINHIRLRANTTNGMYGADIPLDGGFTVLHANNTSGKSTALHAVLYALGLEQMLSPKREVPLSFAMREYLKDPDTNAEYAITESYVEVEIENDHGDRIVVRRDVVKPGSDRRLVQVTQGPGLTSPGNYGRRDYFVAVEGGAKREAGFHHMLARFMDWDLPTVKRYDGADCLLYVETLFPLFFVEQKIGWTNIPGAIPTQFRIRDVHKRSVEYLMGFNTHELELRRQDIDLKIAAVRHVWSTTTDAMQALADAAGMRIMRLPHDPTSIEEEVKGVFLQVVDEGKWGDLQSHLVYLRETHAELEKETIPSVEGIADATRTAMDELNRSIHDLHSVRGEIFRDRQAEIVQQISTNRRIELLEEDYNKNKDSQRLEKYGSTIGRDLVPHHCPTCEQALDDVLLSQGTLDAVMSLEDNIQYIEAQLKAFKRLAGRSVIAIRNLDLELLSSGEDLRQKTTQLRALKTDLMAPSDAASAAFIEEKLRIEHRIEQLIGTRKRFDELVGRLLEQSRQWSQLQDAKSRLPNDRLSFEDRDKITKLQGSIQRQLGQYQFETFGPAALTVSEDTYRPEKEGFEIGFELSASDTIRLKWAYQLGLLDVGLATDTNHPGLLIMDEPRQQEAAELSVAGLFKEASMIASRGAQVLIATSEHLASVEAFVVGLKCQLIKFDGRLIRRLPSVFD